MLEDIQKTLNYVADLLNKLPDSKNLRLQSEIDYCRYITKVTLEKVEKELKDAETD